MLKALQGITAFCVVQLIVVALVAGVSLFQVLASSKQSAKAMVASSSGKVDATARLAILKARLFRAVCKRVCKGLLNKDRLLFALRLAQVTATSIEVNQPGP